MAREIERLTAANVKKLIRDGTVGRHHDGGGLYLDVKDVGQAYWLFRYGRGGRQTQSFGATHAVDQAAARAKRKAAHALLAEGRDPKIEREQIRAAAKIEAAKLVTFTTAAEAYHANHKAAWSSKHAAEVRRLLSDYAEPVLAKLPARSVDTSLVMKVLEPIWRKKTVTASRVRQQIEAVLDFARSRGWREGDNPARWRGHLANLLPKPRKVRPVRHFAAMPYDDVPAFMTRLRKIDSVAARCVEFVVLTVARNSEARKATFDEVSGSNLWVIGAQRMKRRKEHRVPLSANARAIVERMRKTTKGKFIFPGRRKGALGDTALGELLADMKVNATLHGFRSTFRDWAGESGFARELAELALSHRVGDDTETAYARSDLLQRRAKLMDAWARYCAGERVVVPLERRHG